MERYIVYQGDVRPYDPADLPPAHMYGQEWLYVEAQDEADALAQADAYDAGAHPAQTEMELFAAAYRAESIRLPQQEEQTEPDLLAVGDIAAMVGLKADTVDKWRRRYPDFPAPVAETSGGAVWRREEILAWLRQRRRWPVYHRIQLVNKSGSADNWSADVLVDGHFRARLAVWTQDGSQHVRLREGDATILEQVSRQALGLDAIYDLLENVESIWEEKR